MPQTLEEKLKARLSKTVQDAVKEMSAQTVSGYLVKRLVVTGSFRNVLAADGAPQGFEVRTKNKLGVATVVGCTPIKIDGEIFDVGLITIKKGAQTLAAADISERLPMSVSFGDEMTIFVSDAQGLGAGEHEIELGLKMVGLGLMEVKYRDALAGEGRPRVPKKAEPAAPQAEADFDDIMRRAVEMTLEKAGAKVIEESHSILDGITLHLEDINKKYGIELRGKGEAGFTTGPAGGRNVLTIRTTQSVFHNLALGRLNAGLAFARGEVHLEGIPLLKLRGMDALLTTLFQSYRAASAGVEFAEAGAEKAPGMLEDIIGVIIAGVDDALKGLDKFLNLFGVKYTYEKTLNRVERLWEVLDREIRERISFGRVEDKPRAGAEFAPGISPSDKPEPAPVQSLHERLRQRLSSVVETAVAEISRSTVSDYLIKRLIMPGSFRNFGADGKAEGFEVRIKNKLGVATVIGFGAITVDGEKYELDHIRIIKDKTVIPASEVSDRRPLSVTFGDELLIRVERAGGIAAGRHKIALSLDMVGLGGMDVNFEEELKA